MGEFPTHSFCAPDSGTRSPDELRDHVITAEEISKAIRREEAGFLAHSMLVFQRGSEFLEFLPS